MKKHSILAVGLSALLLMTACSSGKMKVNGSFPPVGHLTADSITVPPILMGIASMFVTDDILVAYEPQKDTLFSFWQLPQFDYLFCAGIKGGGPNDFIQPDFTFGVTDEGFKVSEIMVHKVKHMQIDKEEKKLTTIGVQDYVFDEGVANRFICLADGKFCFISMMNKEAEYVLCDDQGNSRYFSPYPEGLLGEGKGEATFSLYNKLTIAHPDGKRFAAFYSYVKLCRIYDDNGNLLNETLLDSPRQPSDPQERKSFIAGRPSADNDYIYLLAAGEKEANVLEIWDWDGNPVAHYLLDKSFNDYVIYPKNHKLYAVDDSRDDGVIYTYDLPELK